MIVILNKHLKEIIIICSTVVIYSCSTNEPHELPYLGIHEINGSDTTYHKIPKFEFYNQDSVQVSNFNLSTSLYVADFFYSYCPTICPRVKSQMLRVYDEFKDESQFKLVSFALDPKRDDIENLNRYSNNLGVKSDTWHFLTGNKDEIWELAEDFLISVKEDKEEPGGIYHSGKIILVDKNGHIRSFAEGTEEKEVDKLMSQIKILLKSYE